MDTVFDKIVGAINKSFGLIRLLVVAMIALGGVLTLLTGNLGGLISSFSLLIIAVMFFEIYRVLCLKGQKISVDIPEIKMPPSSSHDTSSHQ